MRRWPCPMCMAGQRVSVVDGSLIGCPWCAATGHVSLERHRALSLQRRAKAEREAER